MNKDNIIGEILVDKNIISGTKLTDSTITTKMADFTSWFNERIQAVSRDNVIHVLKISDMDILEDFLDNTYSLSLNDTLWIKNKNKNISWAEISQYRVKEYNRIISEIVLNKRYDQNLDFSKLRAISPDFTTGGSVDKCWIREQSSNVSCLFKTSEEHWGGLAGTRPYCEYYANQVVQAFIDDKTHYVPYGIQVSKTFGDGYNKAYCYCPIFTSEQNGFLSYYDSKYRNLTLAELDEKSRNDRDKQIIRELLIVDVLVLNYDRHPGNYGFLIDNDTFRIIGMAPIFDQDCSLGNFVSLQSIDTLEEGYEKAASKGPRTNMGSYIDQARWALTNGLKQRLSEMYPFKFKRLPKDIDLEEERILFMEYIVNRQIQKILDK